MLVHVSDVPVRESGLETSASDLVEALVFGIKEVIQKEISSDSLWHAIHHWTGCPCTGGRRESDLTSLTPSPHYGIIAHGCTCETVDILIAWDADPPHPFKGAPGKSRRETLKEPV
jgi:hypothetical protein